MQCKCEMVKAFLPDFVRERMMQDHVVFNFHDEGRGIRDNVKRVFALSILFSSKLSKGC